MSLFDDAACFLKNRTPTTVKPSETFNLNDPETREKMVVFLRAEYENATLVEIERAIDKTMAETEAPSDKTFFLKKIRPKLED